MHPILITYLIGAAITTFFIGYCESGWVAIEVCGGAVFWPMILPALLGKHARYYVQDRREKRNLLEAEKKKWLNAPLP